MSFRNEGEKLINVRPFASDSANLERKAKRMRQMAIMNGAKVLNNSNETIRGQRNSCHMTHAGFPLVR